MNHRNRKRRESSQNQQRRNLVGQLLDLFRGATPSSESTRKSRRMKGAERLEDRRVMATLTVDTTIDEVDGDTTSIVNLLATPGFDGFISLREAITAANNTAGDDVIQFDPSTNGVPFTLSILNAGGMNEDANATGDLDVLGAGGGLTIVGNGSSQTIIEAGTNSTNGIDKVFAFNPICDAAADFSVSDVTVRFGRNTQAYGSGDFSDTGAGIDYCGFGASSFTLSNSVIDQNTNVNSRGGGLNIDEVDPATSTVTITNTQFTNNTSAQEGAGVNIFGDNAQVTITGSTFSGNQTNSLGGGLNIRLTSANNGDGAPDASVQIDQSLFTANSALGTGSGGGIAVFAAGGFQSVDISNTTISGNSSTVDGGGLFVDDTLSTVTLTNVTITNNLADSDNNSAAHNGGGINRQNGSVLLYNTLVAGNVHGAGATRDDINGLVMGTGLVSGTGHSNLIGDGTGMAGLVDGVNGNQVGTGGSPIDPLLGPLANNGGVVMTHALLDGSPALDAGNNALVVGATDNRGPGFPRILDSDDGNLIATVDVGAFERLFNTPTTSVGLVGGDLVITDTNGGTSDDDITLSLDGTDVLVNDPTNVLQAGPGATNDDPNTVRVPLASITGKILVNTLAGNDGVTVDSTNGLFPRQIEFDGGDGFDRLQLSQTDGPTRDNGFLGVGNEPGNGASFIDTQLVVFRNLEPVIDNVPAATFTISAIPGLATLLDADNAINYATSSIFGAAFGQVTVDNFEPIHFSNKGTLVINAGAGADAINLNNPNTPNGLNDIQVDGGDGADVVTVNGTTNNELITYSPTSATSADIGVAGLPNLTVSTIEAVEIDGQNDFGDDDLSVGTFSFDGTMVLTPGSTADSGGVDFYAGPDFLTFHGPALTFRNLGDDGSVSFDDNPGRFDNLIYQGTSGDDNFEADQDGTVVLNGQLPVFTPSIITLTLAGLTGSDRFEVSPLATDIQLNVEGGGQPGDVLLVNEQLNPIVAAQFQVSPNFSNNLSDTGTVSEAISNTLINYAGIATVQLFATGDDDAVQIFDDLGTNTWRLARGPSVFLESSQLQIDDRTPIQLENFSVVDLVNLGGVDRFVVAPDRLPNLPTTYNLTGLLSGGTFRDTLEIEGTGQGDNPVTLTDTAITLGTSVNYSQMAAIVVNTAAGNDLLEVDASAGPVTTPIFFDGGIGSDTLRVTGAAGGQFDEVIYTPGADPTSGALVYENAANTALMRINFTGLEPVLDNTTATTLTVNGNGSNNAINYSNGPGGVFFGGNPTGLVSVDSGETIEFNNKTNLVLNAGAGDDVITLNGTLAPFGLASLTVNGGTPSASDKLVIMGTAGADVATFTPTGAHSGTLTGLAVPVAFATVEHVVYDGNDAGATDSLTINGTSTNNTFDFDAVSFEGRFRSVLSPDFDTEFVGLITVAGGAGGGDVVNLHASEGADSVVTAANVIAILTPGSIPTITLGAGVDALTVSTLGGNDFVDLSGVLAPITTTVYGGAGNDTIVGSPQNDLLYGGDGNDVIIGGAGIDVVYGDAGDDRFGDPAVADPAANDGGNDQFFGGDGSDTLTWDPGDGSDLFEGGDGVDAMVFNGSAGVEGFTLNAVGARLEFLRSVGAIDMDLADVEQVNLNANGGADIISVNDLFGTGVQAVSINLGTDGSTENVTVNGRTTDDSLMLTSPAAGQLRLNGLTYTVALATTESTDTLRLNGRDGNDQITVAPGAENVMSITLSGELGNDVLTGNVLNLLGHDGNDLLVGGIGNQTFDGGAGDDTFVGNGGTDNVGGGTGSSVGDTILLAGTAGADTFALSLSPTGQLIATINGLTTTYGNFLGGPIATSGIEQILVQGLAGDDLLTVDAVNGQIPIPINYEAGGPGGNDTLQMNDAAFNVVAGDSNDAGHANNTRFSGLENLVLNSSGVGVATINGSSGDDAVTVTGGVGGGQIVSNFGPAITLQNFLAGSTLNLPTGAGIDAIQVNQAANWAFSTVGVDGGDPWAADSIAVRGTANDEQLTYTGLSENSGTLVLTSGTATTYNLVNISAVDVDAEAAAADSLNVTNANAVILPGFAPGSGTVSPFSAGGAALLGLSYSDVETAVVTSTTIVVDGTAGDDTITVSPTGLVQVTNTLGFTNSVDASAATTLVLNTLGGNDAVTIFPSALFAGGISVIGGEPGAGSDSVTVTSANPLGLALILSATPDQLVGVVGGPVALNGVETLNVTSTVNGNLDVLQVVGYGDASDLATINFNAGDVDNDDGDLLFVIGSADSVASSYRPLSPTSATMTNADGPTINVFSFNNGANSLFMFGPGSEELTFHGSADADSIALNGGQVTLTPLAGPPAWVPLNYAGPRSLVIAAAAGDDAITVTTPTISAVHVDGGDPIQFSDTLTVLAGAAAVSYSAGPESDEGAISVGTNDPISFDHIEGIQITGDGTNAATVLGTNADNDITVVGLNATDLTVSIDGGPAVVFANMDSLQVDALAGDDDVDVTVGPLAITSITINGNDPTASDRLVITGTPGVDAVVFTPTSPNAGSLTGLGTPVTFATVEHVVYDGNDLAAFDNVTINGTLTNDTFDYDAVLLEGRFRSFASPEFDTRRSARIAVNGGGAGADVVNLFGSAGADSVTSAANAISVGTPGTLAIITLGAGIDALTVSTLASADSVNLSGVLAPITTTVYGGEGDDTIVGSPQADLLYGGDGNDVIIGGAGIDVAYGEAGNDRFGDPAVADPAANDAGNDQYFGGDGSDTLTWDPGDGSDLFEGGDGADVMIFNGSAGAETFTFNAVGARLEFLRSVGAIDMDLADVEQVNLNANGGADAVVVNDLFNTGVQTVSVNLGTDAANDAVTINGRTTDDSLMLTSPAAGQLQLNGLTYTVAVATTEPTDTLAINGNDGNDQITAGPGAEAVMTITLNGGLGNDSLTGNVPFINGNDGNDLLVGGIGNQTFDGGNGDDTFVGNGGTDNVGGGAGSSVGDTILLSGTAGADTFALSLNPAGQLIATINGLTTTYGNFIGGPIATSGIEQILVEGLAGNDGLTVDSTNGAISIPINFAGGDNADLLTLTGGVATSNTYQVGPGVGDGTSTIVIGGVTQVIRFSNLEPVLDLVGGPLTVVGTNAANTINYSQGSVAANGLVSVDGFETIEFSNKTALTINALAGDDQIHLNNPNTPTGLLAINVNGGDATVGDEVVVSGTALADNVTVDSLVADGARVTGLGGVTVNVSTTEKAIINGLGGGDNLTFISPAGTQLIYLTDDNSVTDAGTVRMRQVLANGGGELLPVSFLGLGGAGTLTFDDVNAGVRTDELTITPRPGNSSDNFAVSSTGVIDLDEDSAGLTNQQLVFISTPGVADLNLLGQDGDDDFFIAGNHPFNQIFVDGGNPSASDVLHFSGSGAGAVTVDLGAARVSEVGFGFVSYSGVETINALTFGANNPSININDTAGDDDIVVTVLNANQGSVVANGVAPTVNYTNANGAPVNFPFAAGGEDTLRIVGNALTQTISANANALAVNLTPPQVPVALALPGFTAVVDDLNNGGADGQVTWTATLESLELFGLEGNDTFNVVAGLIPVFVDGGDPIGVQPGDVINVVAAVPSPITFQAGPESDEGGFKVGTQEVVSFDHIESLGAINAICAIILGTNGDDDITVIARDASTHAGADGVQDFTTSVNAGPDILWFNTPELHIDALSGDDHVVIRTPAPNLAAWNVEVDVAGGAPSAPLNGDRLEVETPGQDTTTYTPTGSDTGVLNIINANGQVAIINIGPFTADCDGDGIDEYVSSAGGFEELWLDGEGANDSLTVVGTVASDLITHTPGAGRDEGSLRVNEMLAISYQNLGLSARLTVNGGPGGRSDHLIAKGTGGSDTMRASRESAAIGTIAVNSQLVLRTDAIEIYTLDGLEGDEQFNVQMPLAGGVSTVNAIGGGPGASDVLTFNGDSNANAFEVIPGQIIHNGLVTVDGVSIPYVGVEAIQMFAGRQAGDALIVRAPFVSQGDNLWTVTSGTSGDRVQINSLESIEYWDFGTVELINEFGTDLFRVYPSSLAGANSLTVTGNGGGLNDDVLELVGTPANDVVTSNATTVTMNGYPVTAGANLVEVRVNTLGGDDSITLGLNLAGTRKVVDGGDGNDTINVSAMVDATIFGGLGDDNITGSPIADLIYGGSGNDVIVGLGGNDTIYGDDGDDTITGSTGNDSLFGGDGSDRFIWNNGDNTDIVEGDEGVDVQVVNGAAAGDVFVLGENPANEARALFQRTNLVPFAIDMGKVEQVDINSGDGADTVNVNDLFTTDVTTVNVNVGGDALLDAVTVEGRTVADSVTLSRYLTTGVNIAGLKYDVNVLALDPINDADTLTFNANGGDDVVSAQDLLNIVFGTTLAQVNRLIINGGDDDDSLSGFGNLNGNDGDDTLVGGNFGQTITGGNNADFLNGGGGDDVLNGGAGEDLFIGGAGADSIDGGDVAGVIEWDAILINGFSGNDTIDVNQTLPTSLTYKVNTNSQTDTVAVLGDGTRTIDEARVDAGSGADLIRVKTADAAVNSMATDGVFNHIVTVVHGGSATGAGDRLVIVDDLADDLTLYRKGQDVTEGNVTIGPGNAEPYETQFDGIERVQFVDELGAAINQDPNGATSRLVMFSTDMNEYNDDRFLSTILGAPLTTSLEGTIDPGAIINPFGDGQNIPGDEDWFKIQANVTGTLDFTTLFEEVGNIVSSGRPGLPGNGDLDIYVYDIDGTLIAGNGGTFGGNNGTGLNPELNVDGDTFAENERVRIPAVAGQSYIVRVIGRAPAGNPTALTGTINAFNLSVTNVAAPVPFDLELQDNPISGVTNPPGTNGNSDTGRTQFDNHTYDNTPTFIFRLDDGVLLNDLPGNNTSTLPPDEITSIPFRPGLAQPALAGYAIAIFDEGATAPAAGNAGNLNIRQPLGFATQIEPGLYAFTVPAGLELTDGSHFITARVQMLDPATPLQTGWGERSASLEIVVDRVAPPAFFGYTNLADTQHGLAAISDSGVNGYPATNVDRVTNDTTPTFYGTAEANAVVRLYVESNGVAGLQSRESGAANPDLFIGLTAANPLDGSNQFPAGNWELTSSLDLNNPNLGGFFTQDGVRRIYVTGEDLAGNITADSAADVLNIFLDTRGPQVTRVDVNARNNAAYNIWDHKGVPDGGNDGTLIPTPLVNSIVISVQDLPARSNVDPNFLYDALFTPVSIDPGQYSLVGDHNGIIPINTITFTADAAANGVIATGFVTITFFEPLPDDRFTLRLSDGITDRVGNNLDGESNTGEPHDNVNTLPSGDGVPGGDFVARFTVDSRAEIGAWISGGAYVDTNGNFEFDPQNPDFVNRDIQYKMQFPEVGPMTDQVFTTDEMAAGKFTPVGAVANDGFDRFAAYGYTGGVYRWLVDTDNNGVANLRVIEPKAINGFPVAGNFDGNAANGDEVGIFTGTTWWLDTNHDYVTDVSFAGSVKGYPIVGDFDGDGRDDLGVWSDDKFSFDLASNGFGTIDDTIAFGFLGVRERPVAADMDGDRVDDIGLWVPDRAGQAPAESAEWYFLVSNFPTPAQKAAATGTANLLDHPFTPIPFGKDLYAQYGNSYAMPVIGNFDPPPTTTGGNGSSGGTLDVNGDGSISPIDALLVINYLNNPTGEAAAASSGFQMDTSRDGAIAPIDALLVINYLNSLNAGEGEGAEVAPIALAPVAPAASLAPVTGATASVATVEDAVDVLFADAVQVSSAAAADDLFDVLAQDEEEKDEAAHDWLFGQM